MAIEESLARGSGRSIPGFDLHAALCACAEHLESFGGHPMAAGVKCLPGRIEAFREALIAHALSLGPECLAPRPHTVDTELGEDELVAETLEDLAHLEPHGEGHPRPLFALRDLRLATTPQVLKERHLKLRLLTQGGRPLTAIAFQRVDRLGELLPAPRALDLVGRLSLNEWNGHRTVEMIISDWRVHRP
jgi:single-stranded-DNA-specific exonuclease